MKNYKLLHKDALLSNLNHFKSKKICAMIKSNAYGHGMKEIISMASENVDYFGVVSVEEGVFARKYTEKPILICSKVLDFKLCKKNNLEVMVDDEKDLENCVKFNMKDMCHLKLDCGMNRFGVKSILNAMLLNDFIEEKGIQLKSIYTHFPNTENEKETRNCFENFQKLKCEIAQEPCICFGGSNIIDYPFQFDMLRLGIGLYGYGSKMLSKVMEIKSYVMKTFFAQCGEYIGYGHKNKVLKDGFYAIVPVGYGDGLRRNLSGKFYVKINGKKFKSIGNICMDAFFVKVDENVKVGDEVVVMNDAQYLAKKIGTISYEILTGFSNIRAETLID